MAMDMHSIRRENLRALIAHQTRGSVAAFCRMYDYQESKLSQMLSTTYRKGNNFGEKAARRLEEKVGLAPLALDSLDRSGSSHQSVGTIHLCNHLSGDLKATEEAYEIAVYNVAASMGNDLSMPEHADVVERMIVSADWLKSCVKFSQADKLALITAYGDSMEGTFSDGDILLIDRGVDDIKIDAIYVLALNDELYIKRLQRRPDGAILMISDNKHYEPYVINTDGRDKFHVLGRVLLTWNSRPL